MHIVPLRSFAPVPCAADSFSLLIGILPRRLRAMRRNMRDGTIKRGAEEIFRGIVLKDASAMDAPAPDRESGERRDHLAVFREFIDHLERAARRGASNDTRPRASGR
jgi:hypothetical protein